MRGFFLDSLLYWRDRFFENTFGLAFLEFYCFSGSFVSFVVVREWFYSLY